MIEQIALVPIDSAGAARGYAGDMPTVVADVLQATVNHYAVVGFVEPWIGYLALVDGTPVGTCGFTGAPRAGRVEIAYYTFPDFEGRGVATAMAQSLIDLAVEHDPALTIAAQTLPERNASHSILQKLNFEHVATLDDPEEGRVWEWRRRLDGATPSERA